MALDFRASQFRGAKFISSGSTGTGARLLFYDISADSTATPNVGVIDTSKFNLSSIGTDIFLYVSGGINQKGVANAKSISVFGGDLHVSGNLTVDGTGAGNNYWQSIDDKIIFNTGSIRQGTDVIIDLPTTNSIILSSQGYARTYGGISNAIISSEGSEIKNTSGVPNDIEFNTVISDSGSIIDGFGLIIEQDQISNTSYNVIAASAQNIIKSGSQGNAIISSQYVTITSSSLLNFVAANYYSTLENTIGSAVITGMNNTISSSDGNQIDSSVIIGSNWIITSSYTYAIGDTINEAALLISASRGIEVSGSTLFRNNTTVSNLASFTAQNITGSLTELTDGTSYLVAGPNITIVTNSNGSITISTSGSFRMELLDYYSTNSTTGVSVGQIIFPANEYTGSLTLRGVIASTDPSTAGSVRLYNITSGAYVHIGGTGIIDLSYKGITPTIVESVDLMTATNFSSASQAIYELQVSCSNGSYTSTFGGFEFRPQGTFSLGSRTNTYTYNTVTGNYTVLNSNQVIAVSASVPVTITLPLSPGNGQFFIIKDVSGSAGTNTITVSSSYGNIDGASTYLINTDYGTAKFMWFNSFWGRI